MGPFEDAPTLFARSTDGTAIAIFAAGAAGGVGAAVAAGAASPANRPLLLVHGTTADHTTWRAVAPLLARARPVYAMDRRGRGRSGDGQDYAIEREFEDVAAAAAALAGGEGTVDVAGHSYGGRCALGASLRAPAIRSVVAYEGAPIPPGIEWADPRAIEAVAGAVRRGENELALETFFRTVIRMDDEAIARYRADPVWPARVAAAPTLIRELDGEANPAAGLEALGAVRVPVLQLLGTVSAPAFRIGATALAERLVDGRIVEIEGAAHAAHHTHPAAFVEAVGAFLDA